MLKFALLLSVLFQLGAAIFAISLIRRTRFNVSWILISLGLVLMAIRRLFDFSILFLESQLFKNDEVNVWIGVLISVLMLVGVIFIRKIFNLQDHIEKLRQENEHNVLSAIIKTEDKARQTFARELHDGLGPVLSSIKMTLSAVDNETLNPFNQKIIESAYKASDSSIVALKEIANNLSPHLLKNYGLEKSAKTLADQLFSSGSVKFRSDFQLNEHRLTDEMKISCYRIVSELMNNSLKHANPSLVILKLTESNNLLLFHYEDDGAGFEYDPSAKRSKTLGMGFNNILSRIKLLKGTFQIHTSPGKGFCIELQIPLV